MSGCRDFRQLLDRSRAGVGDPAVPADDPVALWASANVTSLLNGREESESTPEYGSAAWQQLRGSDPHRAAAIITAAEQWRRQRVCQEWLDQLLDENPKEWFRIVTADADAHARKILPALAKRPTVAELKARTAKRQPPRTVVATPGWPPVAIPGRPGWSRRLVDGQQVDLPDKAQESAA